MATKLFIGGISPSTTSEAIRTHFGKYGPISDAVVMRDRGFGFVTFETQAGADAAIAQPQQTVDGQSVDVKMAVGKGSGRGGGGSDTGSGGSGSAPHKVFVGGLPQDCGDDKIRSYFESYGKIVDAVAMKDRENGRSRGFGFVQFDNQSSVDRVMQDYKNHKIEGKWVEVKRPVPRDQMPPPESRGGGGDNGRGGGDDRGGGGSRGRSGNGDNSQSMPPAPGAYGGYGGYCGYGGYAGYAGCAGYPGYPGYPSYPGYPGYPGCYGGGYPGGYCMPPPGAYGMDPYGSQAGGCGQQQQQQAIQAAPYGYSAPPPGPSSRSAPY